MYGAILQDAPTIVNVIAPHHDTKHLFDVLTELLHEIGLGL